MIHFLEHKDIDFEKWDACIGSSINGLIYPYSFYLNQVSPGWAALIEDDYQSVMPLPVKKKWGFQYIMQPLFIQQLGVFSPHPVSENLIQEYLHSIPSRYIYINYNFNTFNKPGAQLGKPTPLKTFELDLIQPYENLKKQYSTNTRRNLKKAQKEKIFVVKSSTPEPVIDAFRHNRGRKIHTLQNTHYETLKHLIYSGIHRGTAMVYSAYDANNTFCAGTVFFHTHHKAIMIFSGYTPEARKNGAMTILIDAFIQEHCNKNLILDFEGSNDMNLARFYAGFGSKECVYLQLSTFRHPFIPDYLVNLYFQIRKSLKNITT